MKLDNNMDFIVTDAEYQTWWNTRATWWVEPHHYKEVFQIWVAKVLWWQVVERADIIIKPTINSVLTPQSIELSWITQERVDAEWVTYAEWYQRFQDMRWNLDAYTYDNDSNVHLENALLNKMPIDRKELIKVKQTLHYYWINGDDYSSWDLFKALWLDIEWHVHDAFHDSHSLALSIIELKSKS